MSKFIEKIASPIGRPPAYKSPEQLWSKFLEYVDWCDSNPIQIFHNAKVSGNSNAKSSKLQSQSKGMVQRPYLLTGFILMAGISNWCEFKGQKAYQTSDFLTVIRAIENTIRDQQVSGATVGIYNANLTARLNGIADTTKTEITGKDGEPLQFPKLSVSDLEELKKLNGIK